MFADQPRDEIEPAAGRKMHEEAHRPVRPVLRAYDVWYEQSGACRQCGLGELATSNGHQCFLLIFLLVARTKPSGHACGVPEDKLRAIRGRFCRTEKSRISRSLSSGAPLARPVGSCGLRRLP